MTATVRSQSAAVAEMASDWDLLDALMSGTRAMRTAGEKFLPQFPSEEDDSYKVRLKTAVLTNFYKRTCEVMASRPFSQAPGLIDLSGKTAELFGDIDGKGTDFQAFAEILMKNCLSHGLSCVLVDYPGEAPARNKAEEKARNLRPFWAHYPATTILGAKVIRVGGQWVLTQLRLLENAVVEDGEFGEKVVEQVRVLSPGAWAIYRKSDVKDEWLQTESGTTSLSVIPAQFFYGYRGGFGVGVAPLIDLAYLNAEHWQSSSDQQTILHVARVPILFGKGLAKNTKISIGATSAILDDGEKSDLKFVEHSGAAIEAGRQSILDLEERMRQVGGEMLVRRRSTVTATQVVSENDANKCILQSITEALEDGLNHCIVLTGLWTGDDKPGSVELYKDFGTDTLSDASTALLLDAAVADRISDETFFEEMKRRAIIDVDRTWDEEKARIASQPTRTVPKLPIHPGHAD
jgi:hypothetical protein